jgi:16S rRNA G966 N2-methylase RsmD
VANDLIVMKVDRARALLAQARDAADAKKVADAARAAEVYARRQKLSQEVIAYATAVKVDALTLMGEFLKANPPRGAGPGRGHKGGKKTTPKGGVVLGLPPEISWNGSSEAQALADMKGEAPELHEKVRSNKMTVRNGVKEARRRRRQKDMEARAAQAQAQADGQEYGIVTGDFRAAGARVADGSASLIFTDPPYDEDSVPLYDDLAQFAARVLEPGGSLLCYTGHHALPEVLSLMMPHLRYWWYCACVHAGGNRRLPGKYVFVGWKPILWFVKERRGTDDYVSDTVSSERDKEHHDWGQGLGEAQYYIERLTLKGGLVIDPFCGGGTTALAAKGLGRRWLSFEIDPKVAARARARLKEARP